MSIDRLGLTFTIENQQEVNKQYKSLVKEVALASLKEFAIILTFTIPCIFFVSTTGLAPLICGVVSLLAVNTLLRIAPAYYKFKSIKIQRSNQAYDYGLEIEKANRQAATAEQIKSFVCPILFSIVAYATGGILLHEAGHAFAKMLVYKNPSSKISVNPFERGETSFTTGQTTSFGESLGADGRDAFISAAGVLISWIVSCIAISIYYAVRKSKNEKAKEAGRYCLAIGSYNLAMHTTYAISGLTASKDNLSHDFVSLWVKGGMHPLLSAFLIALPILIVIGIEIGKRIHKNRQTVNATPRPPAPVPIARIPSPPVPSQPAPTGVSLRTPKAKEKTVIVRGIITHVSA